MNTRIKELIQQATKVYEPDWNGCERVEEFDKLKFAELIIRECSKVAWQHTPDTEELEYSHLIKDKILTHFGVKE